MTLIKTPCIKNIHKKVEEEETILKDEMPKN